MEPEKVKCENCLQDENLETSYCDQDGYWICAGCMKYATL